MCHYFGGRFCAKGKQKLNEMETTIILLANNTENVLNHVILMLDIKAFSLCFAR